MKSYLNLLPFLALAASVKAQSLQIDQLKKELAAHPKQDTFRVNRLNELAFDLSLKSEERAKFAEEAKKIATKINYAAGKGNALVSLALVKGRDGRSEEFSNLIEEAKSIAGETKNTELVASIFMVEGMVKLRICKNPPARF